jgi:hypothetical protein
MEMHKIASARKQTIKSDTKFPESTQSFTEAEKWCRAQSASDFTVGRDELA